VEELRELVDEFVFAEAAAVLDIVLGGKLTQILDCQRCEIRNIGHGGLSVLVCQ
jgi:hypothetical protein